MSFPDLALHVLHETHRHFVYLARLFTSLLLALMIFCVWLCRSIYRLRRTLEILHDRRYLVLKQGRTSRTLFLPPTCTRDPSSRTRTGSRERHVYVLGDPRVSLQHRLSPNFVEKKSEDASMSSFRFSSEQDTCPSPTRQRTASQ